MGTLRLSREAPDDQKRERVTDGRHSTTAWAQLYTQTVSGAVEIYASKTFLDSVGLPCPCSWSCTNQSERIRLSTQHLTPLHKLRLQCVPLSKVNKLSCTKTACLPMKGEPHRAFVERQWLMVNYRESGQAGPPGDLKAQAHLFIRARWGLLTWTTMLPTSKKCQAFAC